MPVRLIVGLVKWGFILGVLGVGVLGWGYYRMDATGPLKTKTIVQIPQGLTNKDIASFLQDKGIIGNPFLFSSAATLGEMVSHLHLKAGEYEFAPGVTMHDVMGAMLAGHFVKYKIVIPEGFTSQMVVNRLTDQEELTGTITQTPAEGTLLPATWEAVRGDARQKLIDQMTAAGNKVLDDAVAKLPASSPLKTKQDVITLASIVEKETAVPEERPIIAAVFLNRLKKHMRLQTDPSVIYGIVGGAGKLDHPLTREELERPTPYNTYTNDGLPPGPIANPGRASIEAVVNPANVPYLYFVANGSGGHAFATTLEEHNANVKKWRVITGQEEPDPVPRAPAKGKASAALPPTPGTPPQDLPLKTQQK